MPKTKRIGVDERADAAVARRAALLLQKIALRDVRGNHIDFFVENRQKMFRDALGNADGIPLQKSDRTIGNEVGEIALPDGVLRRLLAHERDVSLAGLYGPQAGFDIRIDADLVVGVARAQHAVGHAAVDRCDDGMRQIAETARDGCIVVRRIADGRCHAL